MPFVIKIQDKIADLAHSSIENITEKHCQRQILFLFESDRSDSRLHFKGRHIKLLKAVYTSEL